LRSESSGDGAGGPPRWSGADLFIVDNSDAELKVGQCLAEWAVWANISHQFDIATGYFEIGALLAIGYQRVPRVLLGDGSWWGGGT